MDETIHQEIMVDDNNDPYQENIPTAATNTEPE